MAANSVYIGWTAWAAGPLWGSYSPCCADYGTWGSLEPGSLASDGSPGMYTGVWVNEIQPLLPTTLQKTGMSNVNGPAGLSSSSSTTKASSTSTKTSSSSSSIKTSTTTTSTKSTSSSSTKASTTSSASTATSTALAAHWEQCGGYPGVYTGPTACVSPYVCTYSSPYYSQCL
jgi:endoglucanase